MLLQVTLVCQLRPVVQRNPPVVQHNSGFTVAAGFDSFGVVVGGVFVEGGMPPEPIT